MSTKYRVNATATYFLEFDVEADSATDARIKAIDMATEKRSDADEWDAITAIPHESLVNELPTQE